MSKRIVIIGAGIAGLTAAHNLKKKGLEVIVVEKEASPGGRMRSDFIEGFTIDTGAQFLTNKYRSTLALIEEVGMARQVVPVSGSGAIFRESRIIESRYSFLHLMFRFKGLKFLNRLKMAKIRLDTFNKRSLLDFHAIEKSALLDDESLADYILREIGEEALEYYLQPMVCHKPEGVSKAFLLTLASIAPVELCTLANGNGNLTRRLAESLNVIYGSQVLEIDCGNRRLSGLRLYRDGKEDVLEADVVVSAIPAPQLLLIARGLPEEIRSFLEKVEYEPYVVASFAIRERILPSVCELNIPRKELKIIKSIAFEHNKSALRAPYGKGLITTTVIGEAGRRLMEQNKEEAIESILRELEAIYPGIRDNILFSRIYYHFYGEPQFYPGYIRYLRDFKKEGARAGPLFLAGDYLTGPFVETALSSGLDAARNVLSSFT